MYKASLVAAALCLLITLVSCHYRERRSGISDQRLAEIQTLLALDRQSGSKNVAYGVIDPMKLGKRKRSHDFSNNQMEEDFSADHLLRGGRSAYYRLPERIFRFRDLVENDE